MKKLLLTSSMIITAIVFAATVDLNNLLNYENQNIPTYITKDNTTSGNDITDLGATLGRVLFYDKNLSLNNTISCSSCHIQEFAFGDTAIASDGYNGGTTGRHSMRLINARFADEVHFFWDERAATLEDQTTMPVQDHVEMGFSGQNGNPDIDSLIDKLSTVPYYADLFEATFGDATITENRIQLALAQFVRSIQSFDSKYDQGRALVANDAQPFPNYTTSENNGKTLFLNPPPQGGAGCAGCHRPPEFDIDPAAQNNGIIGVIGSPGSMDLTNTKAPTLRDLFNTNGDLNAPLMHTGEFTDIADVIEHYNLVPQDPNNTALDPRLQGPGGDLQLTTTEKTDLINFLKTLSGTDVYTNPKWSDPFDNQGNITVTPLIGAAISEYDESVNIYPNPFTDKLNISADGNIAQLKIYTIKGQFVTNQNINNQTIDLSYLQSGIYIIEIVFENNIKVVKKVIKE